MWPLRWGSERGLSLGVTTWGGSRHWSPPGQVWCGLKLFVSMDCKNVHSVDFSLPKVTNVLSSSNIYIFQTYILRNSSAKCSTNRFYQSDISIWWWPTPRTGPRGPGGPVPLSLLMSDQPTIKNGPNCSGIKYFNLSKCWWCSVSSTRVSCSPDSARQLIRRGEARLFLIVPNYVLWWL